MKCIKCGGRANVAVHVVDADPLVYCYGCRGSDKPEARFKITAELSITKPATVFDVACGLTTAACLSIRDEDLAGTDQSVLDAVSRVLEENRELREESRKLKIMVQGQGRKLRDPAQHAEATVTDLGDDQRSDEAKKAAKLSAMVEAELIVMVERVSREVGVDRKWVLSDIVYLATQRIRQIKDPTP